MPEDPIDALPDGGSRLILPPSLDLMAAEALQRDLRATIARGRGLTLDAEAIERISTPCLQLIVAAARAARPFAIHAPSDCFRDAVADLGLGAELPL